MDKPRKGGDFYPLKVKCDFRKCSESTRKIGLFPVKYNYKNKAKSQSVEVTKVGKVKENTLRKVEDFFARETTMRGGSEIQVTLEDLRRETRLSLVTIYKAIDDLTSGGKLVVIDTGTRRSPKIYRYLSNSSHEGPRTSTADMAGVAKALEELVHELGVKDQVIEALRAKLSALESQEAQVLYRLRVAEDTEVIVRKRP